MRYGACPLSSQRDGACTLAETKRQSQPTASLALLPSMSHMQSFCREGADQSTASSPSDFTRGPGGKVFVSSSLRLCFASSWAALHARQKNTASAALQRRHLLAGRLTPPPRTATTKIPTHDANVSTTANVQQIEPGKTTHRKALLTVLTHQTSKIHQYRLLLVRHGLTCPAPTSASCSFGASLERNKTRKQERSPDKAHGGERLGELLVESNVIGRTAWWPQRCPRHYSRCCLLLPAPVTDTNCITRRLSAMDPLHCRPRARPRPRCGGRACRCSPYLTGALALDH